MIVQNARVVIIADEAGEREGLFGEFLIDGPQLEMLRTTDLFSATKPTADDSRAIARVFAETAQVVLP